MKSYQDYLAATSEYGVVDQVRYPLAFVSGLPGARIDEVVMFETGQLGYVSELLSDTAHVALLSADPVKPGTKLTRTGQSLQIAVGPGQRGHIITPLGEPMLANIQLNGHSEQRPLNVPPPPIGRRANISRRFETGTSVVDMMVPLASGQREAVIGDIKTGKTSFLLASAKTHSQVGIVVYAAIGRSWSEIRHIADFMTEEMNQENVIVVASGAEDVPSLITVTPHAAMTVAEYWRDKGENVLLILQDLSTHARYYREIALLAERFPGRESYPGDIFYVHARLLERAGNFAYGDGREASITCLVVGETVQGDVSTYIVSNLISITDGHLFFDSSLFAEGRRPSVEVAASVTRVGLKVQTPLGKQVNLNLMAFLAQFRQAQQFSKFGTGLNEEIRATLASGTRLHSFFSQPAFLTVPMAVQLVMGVMIWKGWLNDQPEDAPALWRDRLTLHYEGSQDTKQLLDELVAVEDVDAFVRQLGEHRPKITELCQSEILSPAR